MKSLLIRIIFSTGFALFFITATVINIATTIVAS